MRPRLYDDTHTSPPLVRPESSPFPAAPPGAFITIRRGAREHHHSTAEITLTRAEAYAVSCGLLYTSDAGVNASLSAREDCCQALHDLQLEVAIRHAGDWWGKGDPACLRIEELLDQGRDAEYFRLAVDGLAPILELLPGLLARAEQVLEWYRADRDRCENGPCLEEYADYCVVWERCRDALRGLPGRLGVEVAQPVA